MQVRISPPGKMHQVEERLQLTGSIAKLPAESQRRTTKDQKSLQDTEDGGEATADRE